MAESQVDPHADPQGGSPAGTDRTGALIAPVCGHTPEVHQDAFVAPTAVVLGAVTLAAGTGVWYHAVLRGDCEAISIGENSNIQDNCTVHADPGFPVAVGIALSARLQASPRRTFVVLGDGELQEGSNWEAAMTGAHYGLSSLFAVVDRNGLQQGARTEETKQLEPLADKWASFGWEVREVDGHDHAELLGAFRRPGTTRPVCVIAHTVKGKGVSFMEDRVEWHHKVPSDEQAETALRELSA